MRRCCRPGPARVGRGYGPEKNSSCWNETSSRNPAPDSGNLLPPSSRSRLKPREKHSGGIKRDLKAARNHQEKAHGGKNPAPVGSWKEEKALPRSPSLFRKIGSRFSASHVDRFTPNPCASPNSSRILTLPSLTRPAFPVSSLSRCFFPALGTLPGPERGAPVTLRARGGGHGPLAALIAAICGSRTPEAPWGVSTSPVPGAAPKKPFPAEIIPEIPQKSGGIGVDTRPMDPVGSSRHG